MQLHGFSEQFSRPETDCGSAVAPLPGYCTIQHGVNFKGNTADSLCEASSSRDASSYTQKKPAFHKHKKQYQEPTAEKRENEVNINTAPSDGTQYEIKKSVQ
jgi:hypothetical protein